jgi:hypothetical protein
MEYIEKNINDYIQLAIAKCEENKNDFKLIKFLKKVESNEGKQKLKENVFVLLNLSINSLKNNSNNSLLEASSFELDIIHVIEDAAKELSTIDSLYLENINAEFLEKSHTRAFWEFYSGTLINKGNGILFCHWRKSELEDIVKYFFSTRLGLLECLNKKKMRDSLKGLPLFFERQEGLIQSVKIDTAGKIAIKVCFDFKTRLEKEFIIDGESVLCDGKLIENSKSKIIIQIPETVDANSNLHIHDPSKEKPISVHCHLTNLILLISQLGNIDDSIVEKIAKEIAKVVASYSLSLGFKWANEYAESLKSELKNPMIQKSFNPSCVEKFISAFVVALKENKNPSTVYENLELFKSNFREIKITDSMTFGAFEDFCNNYRSSIDLAVKTDDLHILNILPEGKNVYFRPYEIKQDRRVVKLIYVVDSKKNVIVAQEHLFGSKSDRPAHSQLAKWSTVYGAGELIFEKHEESWYLIEVNNGSGHYRPPAHQSLTFALKCITEKLNSDIKIPEAGVSLLNCLKPGLPFS